MKRLSLLYLNETVVYYVQYIDKNLQVWDGLSIGILFGLCPFMQILELCIVEFTEPQKQYSVQSDHEGHNEEQSLPLEV